VSGAGPEAPRAGGRTGINVPWMIVLAAAGAGLGAALAFGVRAVGVS
jgi:hypothetical protein